MQIVTANGFDYEFPDDMPDAEITKAIQGDLQNSSHLSPQPNQAKEFNDKYGLHPFFGVPEEYNTLTHGIDQGAGYAVGDELTAAGAASVAKLKSLFNDDEVDWNNAYDEALAAHRGHRDTFVKENPKKALAAEIAGGLVLPGGSVNTAVKTGSKLKSTVKAATAAGAMGGVYGFNAGEGDLENRLHTATNAALFGTEAGIVARPVAAGASKAVNGIVDPLMALQKARRSAKKSDKSVFQLLMNQRQTQRAQKSIKNLVERSGKTEEEIQQSLLKAAQDGQSEYALVDALGHPGQRMLSGFTRSTPEVAPQVQDHLISRQAGQGNRVSSFLADAFDAPNTADATEAAMKQARSNAANINYANARNNAGQVEVRDALNTIDKRIGGMQGSGVKGDGIDSKLLSFRKRLAAADPQKSLFEPTPNSIELSDFDRVLGVKQDVQDAIGAALKAGRNNEARELKKLVTSIDEALENSSSGYRTANDQFARASREIEQIKNGKNAAGARNRAEDTIDTFNNLTDAEKAAFRVGYVDPHITKVESGAVGSNSARPFTSQKFQQEAQTMSVDPELLKRRLARENEMFATNNTVLGGSRTADNLIDMEDASRFDGSALAMLLRGNIIEGANQLASPVVNRLKGHNPQVRKEAANMLLSKGKESSNLLQHLLMHREKERINRQLLTDILTATGGIGAGVSQN